MMEQFFMSTANAMGGAANTQGQGQGNFFVSLLPLVVIFAIFYFLMIRPQQKQQKKIQEMLSQLKKGDNVITRGGLHGTIYGITDGTVTLEIAKDIRVKYNREAVASIVSNQPQGE